MSFKPMLYFSLALLTMCTSKSRVDLLVKAKKVYTVDQQFTIANAFVVHQGKIVAVGQADSLLRYYNPVEVLDYSDNYIYPGFIDAHCHFFGYGEMSENIWLGDYSSWEELVEALRKIYSDNPTPWIVGRGWDQNRWDPAQMPDKKQLDQYFPETPVYLVRVDGHCAVVNSRALQLAGITAETTIKGGEIIVQNGEPNGLLIDNAKDYMRTFIPKPSNSDLERQLLKAQKDCFAVGLTSVTDAGLPYEKILLLDSLQGVGKIVMHVNAMLEPDKKNIQNIVYGKPSFNSKLTVRTLKLYADGALGSRGALLFEPYSDYPSATGILVTSEDSINKICRIAWENNFSVAVHAIGDKAVNIVLNIYSNYLTPDNDLRWRIEHAQVVHPDDFSRFRQLKVVPSIQPTHATSDMLWAEKRLGKRIQNAYAYKKLLEQNGWLPSGSDFPIESINPLEGFYAAVTRKNRNGEPEGGFLPENALSRIEALNAMTLWAAKAGFDELQRGSIEPSKVADWVVLDRDIMEVDVNELLKTQVLATFIDGNMVFQR